MAGAMDAKRDFSAIGDQDFFEHGCRLFDQHQNFAKLNGLAAFDGDLCDLAGVRRANLVEGFHRFDEKKRVPLFYEIADIDEILRAWFRCQKGGANDWRLYGTGVGGQVAGVGPCVGGFAFNDKICRFAAAARDPDMPLGGAIFGGFVFMAVGLAIGSHSAHLSCRGPALLVALELGLLWPTFLVLPTLIQ